MSPEGSSLFFQVIPASLRFSAEEKRTLKAFAQTLSVQVADGRTFCCLLTNDRKLQRLNREFLQRDYATDVLSFPTAEGNGQLGEVAISVERAAAQAEEFGHALADEIRILMLHGVLHLFGMDHEQDQGQMARAEVVWRRKLRLPNSLIERSRR